MSPAAIGVCLALVCSVTWGIANVFIQRAARSTGELRSLLWAQAIGSAVLLPLGIALDGVPVVVVEGSLVGAVAVTAAASALGYYGMMRAFRQGSLGAITPIVTAWPIAAAVAGIVWLGERPTGYQALGAALVILGAAGNGALSRGGDWRGSRRDAILWAAASALGFGVMTAGVAWLRPRVGDLTVIPLVWGAQWVLLTPVIARSPELLRPPGDWPPILGMAAFEAIGFVAFSFATRFAPVAVVSPPASLSTLLTVGVSALVLGERISAGRWGLVVLAVLGTVLIAG